jgi:hypothetical protein
MNPRKAFRRRRRTPSLREQILDDLKRALIDRPWNPNEPPRPTYSTAGDDCPCDECRMARARDVSENPRIIQVQPKELERLYDLAAGLKFTESQLYSYCVKKFGRPAPLLREVEAAAIIAHLERGDIIGTN